MFKTPEKKTEEKKFSLTFYYCRRFRIAICNTFHKHVYRQRDALYNIVPDIRAFIVVTVQNIFATISKLSTTYENGIC